jgi:hypothetical protein
MTQSNEIPLDEVARKIAVDRLLDDLGWGVLLVMTGTFWLLPAGHVPRGSWLIAVGLILLTLSAARHILRIRMNCFALVAGLLALIFGTGAYLSVNLPLFPIVLIVVGACWLLLSESEDCSIASRPTGRHCCE